MKRPLFAHIDHSNADIAAWLYETGAAMLRAAAQLDTATGLMVPHEETVYATRALELCKDVHRLFAHWGDENPVFEADHKEIH